MPIFIIAEAGVNHNGSLEQALKMVDAAVEAGADAIKFQTFQAEKLATNLAAKAAYQKQADAEPETQLAMLQKLELKYEFHFELNHYCHQRGIQFLSTAFDSESLQFLVDEIEIPILKIASGEITNGPFLLAHAKTARPIILSTGMASLAEIETALSVLAFGYLGYEQPCLAEFQKAYSSSAGQSLLREKVTLLHCTSEYPTPIQHINLRAMQVLKAAFGLAVGYSDHSLGITVPIAAAALGACVLEKHFTLNKNLPGPDQKMSLEPEELKQMVAGIREVEQALGLAIKFPQTVELENRQVARKSLIAGQAINAGEYFSVENLAVKRPGTGISPMEYWHLLGQCSSRSYTIDELLK